MLIVYLHDNKIIWKDAGNSGSKAFNALDGTTSIFFSDPEIILGYFESIEEFERLHPEYFLGV